MLGLVALVLFFVVCFTLSITLLVEQFYTPKPRELARPILDDSYDNVCKRIR